MKFVFPSEKYQNNAADYINEFYEYSSQIHGCGELDRYLKENSYSEWVQKVLTYIDIANIPAH